MFAESTLAEIRERMNIVELVGEYVQLKKAGQGFLGLCPFHGEKTPSFHVHPLRQCFHCFGCQKGGNVFTFLCGIEGLSFPEAVKRLAKRTGVEIEETEYKARPKPAEPQSHERLRAAHEWAAKYFHYLLTDVPEYRFAKEYLQSRGITEKTIQRFRIGVSPKGWNTLLNLMLKRNFKFEELTQGGLVIPKENSPTQGYDRFRGRLMFPIRDLDGNTVGFGARLLGEEENQPKYLNSPESPVFSKRRILYGLHENQRGVRLRGEAILVEGYMDVVGLHEAGVDNAVATMGTAVTDEHLAQFRGMTRRVVTVFDPDSAGADAWRRSVHLFMGAGVYAKDLSLPEGMDPDEFVLKEGSEKFYQLCERAPRQVTKLLKEIASRGPLSEEESARLLEDLTPILVASRRLPDRALLWDDISLVLKVSVSALRELAEAGSMAYRRDEKRPATSQTYAPSPSRAAPRKQLHPIDLEFFQACIEWPEEFLKVAPEEWKGGLRHPKVEAWLLELAQAKDIAEWEQRLQELVQKETDPELLAAASKGLFPEEARPEQSKESGIFAQIVQRVSRRKSELEIRALSAQVKLTQRLGDDAEQIRLLERLKDLRASLTK